MTISAKQILAAVVGLLTIVAAVYGMTEYFTPREVAELWIADLQQNQMQIQRNSQIQNAQNWLLFWQMRVSNLQAACHGRPFDENLKAQLAEAKRQRDIWQQEVNRLMQQ
jgi:hypothetical protein